MTTHFFKSIARPALAATLSATLAFSPMTATPARAGDAEAAVAVAGIFALILGGIALSQHDRDDGPRWGVTPGPRGPGTHPRPGVHPRPRTSKVLPSECRMVVNRGPNQGRFFIRHCLKREYPRWTYLPSRCEETLNRPGRRPLTAYRGRCLASFGYTADDRIR